MFDKKKIPIFFTFDNNYVVPAAVAFFSLLNKAKENVFYEMWVLHSNITDENQKLLQAVVQKFDKAKLTFLDAKNLFNDEWLENNFQNSFAGSVFTKDTILRCFGARFFPQYDKIIYSDVDIVVVDDISELYDLNLDNSYIGAVKNPFIVYGNELSHLKAEHYKMLKDSYFGGGIWVLNLKKIRQDNLESRMIEIINDKTIVKRWNDQDIMNIACENKVKFIPLNYISYPYMLDLLKTPDFYSSYSREELFDSIINPKIIHFASNKPWNSKPNYANLWNTLFEYLKLPRTSIFNKIDINTPAPKHGFLHRSKSFIKRHKKIVFLLLLAEQVVLIGIIAFLFIKMNFQ